MKTPGHFRDRGFFFSTQNKKVPSAFGWDLLLFLQASQEMLNDGRAVFVGFQIGM